MQKISLYIIFFISIPTSIYSMEGPYSSYCTSIPLVTQNLGSYYIPPNVPEAQVSSSVQPYTNTTSTSLSCYPYYQQAPSSHQQGSEFQDPCKQKRLQLVNETLNNQYPINTIFKSEQENHQFRLSALAIAVIYKDCNACIKLLNRGADPYLQYYCHQTKRYYPSPLHLAFMLKNQDIVTTLTRTPLDPDRKLTTHFEWRKNSLHELNSPLSLEYLQEQFYSSISTCSVQSSLGQSSFNKDADLPKTVFGKITAFFYANKLANFTEIFDIPCLNLKLNLLGLAAFLNYTHYVEQFLKDGALPHNDYNDVISPLYAALLVPNPLNCSYTCITVETLLQYGANPFVKSNVAFRKKLPSNNNKEIEVYRLPYMRSVLQLAQERGYDRAAQAILNAQQKYKSTQTNSSTSSAYSYSSSNFRSQERGRRSDQSTRYHNNTSRKKHHLKKLKKPTCKRRRTGDK